jgi:ribosomal protein S12 methylthiotransferase accessory factor
MTELVVGFDTSGSCFGGTEMDAAIGSADGSVRFFGLTPTSMKLEGLDRHERLIDSYKKLHKARGKAVN